VKVGVIHFQLRIFHGFGILFEDKIDLSQMCLSSVLKWWLKRILQKLKPRWCVVVWVFI